MQKKYRIIKLILLALLIIIALASSYYGCRNALLSSKDFVSHWATNKIILNGENPYQMSLQHSYSPYSRKLLENEKTEFIDVQYFPSARLFMIPYSLMSLDDAIKAWLISNIIFTLILLYVIYIFLRDSGITNQNFLLVSLLFLSGTPFRGTLGNGQLSIAAFSFFFLSLYFTRKENFFLGGIFLALSLVKYSLILPFILFFFIFEKKWVPIIICFLIHFISHLWVCYTIKADPISIFSDILKLNSSLVVNFSSYDTFSLLRFVGRYFNCGSLSNYLSVIFTLFLLFVVSFLWFKKRKNEIDINMLSIISVFLMLSYYHRIYDAICLIFPLFSIIMIRNCKYFRFLLLLGTCYFFFLEKVLDEMNKRSYMQISQIQFVFGYFLLLLMFYSLFRIILFERNRLKIG